jgi:hypothetical protein
MLHSIVLLYQEVVPKSVPETYTQPGYTSRCGFSWTLGVGSDMTFLGKALRGFRWGSLSLFE